MRKTTEDYLKMIYRIQLQAGTVRSVAVAKAFGVSRPTVSTIVKRLIAKGYVAMEKDRSVRLTEKGLSFAEETIERNRIIRRFLLSLGVEQAAAEADACEMEHVISPQTLAALKAFAESKDLNLQNVLQKPLDKLACTNYNSKRLEDTNRVFKTRG